MRMGWQNMLEAETVWGKWLPGRSLRGYMSSVDAAQTMPCRSQLLLPHSPTRRLAMLPWHKPQPALPEPLQNTRREEEPCSSQCLLNLLPQCCQLLPSSIQAADHTYVCLMHPFLWFYFCATAAHVHTATHHTCCSICPFAAASCSRALPSGRGSATFLCSPLPCPGARCCCCCLPAEGMPCQLRQSAPARCIGENAILGLGQRHANLQSAPPAGPCQ